MKSEIKIVNSPRIVVFGVLCILAGTISMLTMAAWGFTVYLA